MVGIQIFFIRERGKELKKIKENENERDLVLHENYKTNFNENLDIDTSRYSCSSPEYQMQTEIGCDNPLANPRLVSLLYRAGSLNHFAMPLSMPLTKNKFLNSVSIVCLGNNWETPTDSAAAMPVILLFFPMCFWK